MESMKKERALSTNLFIGSMLFLVALFAAVVAVNFFVQKKTIYGIHEREMAEVIRYVESYIDRDDLYHCFKTGKTSEKYDRLQEFMDRFIDNYGLHYLYLIHPEQTAEGYRVVNIICGNSMYEKKHLQAAVLSLGDVDPQITDEKVIRQYIKAMEKDGLSFLYGEKGWDGDYTAVLPIANSKGRVFGLLCVDEHMTEITESLLWDMTANTFFIFMFGGLFLFSLTRWLSRSVAVPLAQMSEILSGMNFDKDVDRLSVIEELDAMKGGALEVTALRHALEVFMLQSHYFSADLASAQKEMTDMDQHMHTDVLTGLGNSRQFSEETEKLDDAMQKEDFRDYAVIVVDANNLKYINDTFGHEKGDVYIKGCAGVLSRSCEKDIICRTGGDEFVALFIGDNAAYRARTAEVRLTSEYYDSSTADAEPWEKYSASVGLAFCEEDDMHFTDVLKRADKRMYEAKMKHKEKYGSYR